MSGAEQFTAAVPERSGPMDWRGPRRTLLSGGQDRQFAPPRCKLMETGFEWAVCS
jgi:hypothetical protein